MININSGATLYGTILLPPVTPSYRFEEHDIVNNSNDDESAVNITSRMSNKINVMRNKQQDSKCQCRNRSTVVKH